MTGSAAVEGPLGLQAPRVDLRRLAVAGLISLLLHVLIVMLLLLVVSPDKPAGEEEIYVPLTLEQPPPPPQLPQATPPPVSPPPPVDKQEAEEQKAEPKPAIPEDASLLGWNSEGEEKRRPDRPPGPELDVHAPPKPLGGEDLEPGSEEPEEIKPEEKIAETEPEEQQPPSPQPPPEQQEPPEPTRPLDSSEPETRQRQQAPEDLPLEPLAPAPGAAASRPEPTPLPERPSRPPTSGERPRPRRPLDFNAQIQGGYFGDLKFDSSDYNWSEYSTKVYFAVYRAWLRELFSRVLRFQRDQSLLGLPNLDGKVHIHFVFHRDGHVDQIQVVSPSPIPTLDRASSVALERAVLPPLPADFPRDQEGITFSFEIFGFQSAQQLERRLKYSRYQGEF